jgi:HPt (histidine-containing phosphotransfer) domain-containing protein
MKLLRLAMGLLCAMPLVGLADPSGLRVAAKASTSRPAEVKLTMRQRMKDFAASPQQIKEAEIFFEAHTPNHFRAYKKALERGNGTHPWMQKWLAHNHMELKAIEAADAQLYAMKLDQLQIEDKLFGIVADAPEKGTGEREKLRAEMRPLAKALAEKRKEEAAHRIARMQAALAAEQAQLNEMDNASEPWVDKRIAEEFKRNGRLFPPADGRPGPTTAED